MRLRGAEEHLFSSPGVKLDGEASRRTLVDLRGHTNFQFDARLRGDGFSMTYEGARCGIWPHRAVNFRVDLRKSPARFVCD